MRAVFGDEFVERDAELVGDCGFELLDPQCRLRPCHLVAMNSVGELGQLGGQGTRSFLGLVDLSSAFGAPPHQFVAARARLGHDRLEFGGDPLGGAGDHRRHFGGPAAGGLGSFGAGAVLAFGACGPAQRIRLAPHRFRALLGGTHRQPGLDLHGSGLGQRRGGLLAFLCGGVGSGVGIGVRIGFGFGVPQPGLEFGQCRQVLVACGFGLGALGLGPLVVAVRAPRGGTEPAQPVVDRDQRLIGFVQCQQRLVDGLFTVVLLGQGAGQRGLEFFGVPLPRLEFGCGGVDIGLHLDLAGGPIGAAQQPAGTTEIAVTGHYPQFRPGGQYFGGARQIVGDDGAGCQRRDRSQQVIRTLDDVDEAACTGRQLTDIATGTGGVAVDHGGTPTVGLLERPDRLLRGAVRLGGDGVGEGPEGRGDGRLESAVHPQNSRQTPAQPVGTVVQQPGAAVLTGQAHGECLDASGQRGDLLTGLAITFAQFVDPRIGQLQGLGGVLVGGVESFLTGVQLTQLCLDRFEFGLGGVAALPGGGQGLRQPRDIALGGLGPVAQIVDLPGQACQPLAPVRDRAHRGQMGLLGGLGGLLPVVELIACGLEGLGGHLDRFEQFGFLGLHPIGLGLELFGIAATAGGLLDGEVASPVTRDADGGIDPLDQRRQLEPGLRGGLGAGGEARQLEFLLCQRRVGGIEFGLHGDLLFAREGFLALL